MTNRNKSESQKVLWLEARTWALAIGWLQSILSVLGLIPTIIVFIYLKQIVVEMGADVKGDEEREQELRIFHAVGITMLVLRCIALLVLLFTGIALIRGVQEQNIRRMLIWCVVQIIVLVLTVLFVASSWYTKSLIGVISGCIALIFNIICLWLVYTHRQELVNATAYATRVAQRATAQLNYARRKV